MAADDDSSSRPWQKPRCESSGADAGFCGLQGRRRRKAVRRRPATLSVSESAAAAKAGRDGLQPLLVQLHLQPQDPGGRPRCRTFQSLSCT